MGQTYHLNCESCGDTFWSNAPFPTPQLCCYCLTVDNAALRKRLALVRERAMEWKLMSIVRLIDAAYPDGGE
jgi:hypothetical protein